jgi:hypothetical protein
MTALMRKDCVVRLISWWMLGVSASLVACANDPVQYRAAPPTAANFLLWDCARIQDDADLQQRNAVALAYVPDSDAGNSVLALGSGLSIYWPALLAMRTSGMEARDLQRLRARFDALQTAATVRRCAYMLGEPAGSLPTQQRLQVGQRLVFEERRNPRSQGHDWRVQLTRLDGQGLMFSGQAGQESVWQQDASGNMVNAPEGALWWPQLLRPDLMLGQVTVGDMLVQGDPLARARLRGQMVALGPQMLAGQRFDAAVIELFGDAPSGDAYTRVDGVIVIDRSSGLLLRLELRSAHPAFNLQRKLLRLEPGAP